MRHLCAALLVAVLFACVATARQTEHRIVKAVPVTAEMCLFLSYSSLCVAEPGQCLDLVTTSYTLTNYSVRHGDVIKAPETLSIGLGGVFVLCAEANSPLNASFSLVNETLTAGINVAVSRSGSNFQYSFSLAYPNNFYFSMHFPIEESLHCYTKSSDSCFNYAISVNLLQSAAESKTPVISRH